MNTTRENFMMPDEGLGAAGSDRLQAIVDSALDGLITIDKSGCVETFNPACERIFGYRADEVIGRNVKMLMPDPYHAEHDGYIRNYQETGAPKIIGTAGREVSGRRKDGSLFPLELSVSHFQLKDGQHFCGIIRDITDRREAEKKNALLAAIVESSEDAIIGKTLEGVISTWNKGATHLFGFTADEAIGQNGNLIIPPEKRQEEAFIIEQVGKGQPVEHMESLRMNKQGDRIDVALTVSPVLDKEGKVIGASKIVHDITGRKRVERELRTSVLSLKRSNQELDDFAYIASHDLKEPLRGLSNNALFLKEDCADKLDATNVKRLDRMIYLCERMERLVNDLLYFSRLGRQELAVQPTDLNAVIGDIEAMMETTLQTANATIHIDGGLPTLVCDLPRMTEVFRNLITNAVKYNDKPEKRIDVGCAMQKGERVFYVRDNGIGIPAQFYQDVFRIFKRLNDEDDSAKGTGVGLTFVKKIIERHGGRIWIESEIGKGTVFYFTINEPGKVEP